MLAVEVPSTNSRFRLKEVPVMIRFACPVCHKIMKAPEKGVGKKISCPKCGQRLEIPPPVQVQNKTVLGQPLPEKIPAVPISSAPVPPVPPPLPLPVPQPSDPDGMNDLNGKRGWWGRLWRAGRNLSRTGKTLAALGVCFCLVSGMMAGGWWLLGDRLRSHYAAAGLPLAEPATCREVAERLQARGMQIRWKPRAYRYPSIVIAEKDSVADGWLHILEEQNLYPYARGWVIVIQFPTAKEALEEAGRFPDAVAWGRFMFRGQEDLIADIKRKL